MTAKVLVVDDDPVALQLVVYALSSEGHEVISADNGEQALLTICSEQPNLVVLDNSLPGISGVEVCRRLRAAPETARLPVIMLSARDTVADKIEGLEAGVDTYLAKPTDPAEIVARVAALLGQTSPAQGGTGLRARGRLLAVFGSKGGVGTTFVAVNLAIALRQTTGKAVALVDAKMQFGDVAATLNLAVAHTLLTCIPHQDSLDEELMNSVLVTHTSGIRVLAADPQPDANASLAPALVRQLLAKLQELFDYVVVDAASVLDDRTTAILDLAETIVLLITPQLSSLRNARLLLGTQQFSARSRQELLTTLNQYLERGGIELTDMERALNVQVAARIPSDAPLVLYSLNQGLPLVLSHPKSAVARSLFELARTLT
jgi:pilus assembly protein CpaE